MSQNVHNKLLGSQFYQYERRSSRNYIYIMDLNIYMLAMHEDTFGILWTSKAQGRLPILENMNNYCVFLTYFTF